MDKTQVTPIQELIEMFKAQKSYDTFDAVSIICILNGKLPTERKFAETCFDAGFDYAVESYESSNHGTINIQPDFNECFKQYTHE